MENKRFFSGNWQSWDAVPPPEMNTGAGADRLRHSFVHAAWDQPMQHDAHAQFESELSSLVSSPSSAAPAAGNDSVVIGELIGRLGSICNSAENSPSSRYNSAHTSCYSTPMNSPPKFNLSGGDPHQQHAPRGLPVQGTQMAAAQFAALAADPGFAERAARFSCFGARTHGGLGVQSGFPEAGNLSRVSSSQSLMAAVPEPERMEIEGAKLGGRPSGPSTPEETEHGNGQVGASSAGGAAEKNGRKRKAASKGNKAKGPPLSSRSHPKEKISDSKIYKPAETSGAAVKPKTEENGDGGQKQGEDSNARPREPPKDYIHVRARRGQATDSHSLAERVRREKISERMKLLQDLVPGCNKVTGKAVMLDEIINYVQSLQRQVEFLSMKLATLNPQLDFNMGMTLPPKDMHQGRGPQPQQMCPLDMASSALFPFQNAVTTLESSSALRRLPSLQLPPLDGFTDAYSQVGNFSEDDLQFVVQMASQSLQAE